MVKLQATESGAHLHVLSYLLVEALDGLFSLLLTILNGLFQPLLEKHIRIHGMNIFFCASADLLILRIYLERDGEPILCLVVPSVQVGGQADDRGLLSVPIPSYLSSKRKARYLHLGVATIPGHSEAPPRHVHGRLIDQTWSRLRAMQDLLATVVHKCESNASRCLLCKSWE